MSKPCPMCNIHVATNDPEKVERNGKTYHGNCWRNATKPAVLHCHPRQQHFQFNRWQRLSVN